MLRLIDRESHMTEEEYLTERLDNQQTWYSRKSRLNRKLFLILRLVEIVSAALIPLFSGMGEELPYLKWVIGGLGVLIAISVAITHLFKHQEDWIGYRTTAEQLKHEKYMYLTNTKPYDRENKFYSLVECVESLISKENSFWVTHTTHGKDNMRLSLN